jgi:MFS transporter, putative metabolite:H+ symporter
VRDIVIRIKSRMKQRTFASPSRIGAVTYHRPIWFWLGVSLVTSGTLLHVPMYLHGRHNGFRLVGMPMDAGMLWGMAAIIVGLAASLYGLFPASGFRGTRVSSNLRVQAMDDAAISWPHVGLLATMAVAVTIDIMKPTALAFVVPGMTAEYNLKSPLNPGGTIPAACLALAGISGTVLGSLLWGWLGDRIGRRASILFAGINFIATSICGAMPDFYWNLGMCFLMGLAVGGMLPIAYALLAETIPARHRGWLMVLVGADIAGAYVLTSWLAAALVPEYSWRILWLIGLPTGVLFIMLNRWIPESPRFLLANGRDAEAHAVMKRYGAAIIEESRVNLALPPHGAQWRQLFMHGSAGLTLTVGCLGIAAGLVLFGFNLWIPTNLRKLGFTEADSILRNAAVMGLPLTVLVAWLYGFWSSKRTILLLASITALALFGFAFGGERLIENRLLLHVLLVVPIWGINSLVAVLSVYSAEIYPTPVRSRGAGLCAAASKLGGVGVIALVAMGFASPGIAEVALIGAVPMAIAAVACALLGVETRMRSLEHIAPDNHVAGLQPNRQAGHQRAN